MEDTNQKRLDALGKATAAAAFRKRKIHDARGGMREVCFSLPACDYERIQAAAMLDHRSAANFMWHAAILAADQLVKPAQAGFKPV